MTAREAPAAGVGASRFLFATWDGGGNAIAALSLARRLAARGGRVTVLAPESLRARTEEAGCAFSRYVSAAGARSSSGSSDPARPSPSPIGPLGRLRTRLVLSPELAFAGSARAFAEDVLTEIERTKPDALAVDFMLPGALAAAELAGVPTAVLLHTIYPLPAPALPPFGWGLPPAAGAAGRVRDAVLAEARRRAAARRLGALNEARCSLGLRSVSSAETQIEWAARVLVLTTEGFDFPALRPASVRYVGPQLDGPPPAWTAPGAGEPLVVVSFSTYAVEAAVVQRVLDALAELPVRGLVTLGGQPEKMLRTPANVALTDFVPHAAVLPGAALVVTHAGLGTVMAALACGVPLLCIPLRADQLDNAARVIRAEAGRRLSRHAGRIRLRHAILDLLRDPRYRAGARRMAQTISAAGPDVAAEELERLATTGP